MPHRLLERDDELDLLAVALHRARSEQGSVALVSGEAGIGKTALLRGFVESLPHDIVVLSGACEDLFSPRVLGPFREMFPRHELHDPEQAGALLMRQTGSGAGALVAVVDDAHWADDASLDVIRYVGRRVATLPILLIVAYRSEAADDARLRTVLGTLVGPSVHRIELHGLTDAAVRAWAERAGIAWERVAGLGGNPFLVSEVIATRSDLPTSVRDAIVGRVAALPPDVGEVVKTVAICPRSIALDVLAEVHDDLTRRLTEAEHAGLCEVRRGAASFRHEIMRRAVEWSLTGVDRTVRHRRVLEALMAHDADPSVVLHHAIGAQAGNVILSVAPVMAVRAEAAEAHSEALAASRAALDHADDLDVSTHVRLHSIAARAALNLDRATDGWAHACAAVEAANEAGVAGDELSREVHADALLTKARLAAVLGDAHSAATCARAIIALCGDEPSTPLARAYETLATLAVFAGDNDEAVAQAERAQAIADATDDPITRMRADVPRGLARAAQGDPAGREIIRIARDGLHAAGQAEPEARAVTNLAVVALADEDLAEARMHLEEAVSLAEEHDNANLLYFARAHLAHIDLLEGRWPAAESALRTLIDDLQEAAPLRCLAESFLGRLLIRRGDEHGRTLLVDAWKIASSAGLIRRELYCAVPMLELAWLDDDREAGAEWARITTDLARLCGSHWGLRETRAWAGRLGVVSRVEDEMDAAPAAPHRIAPYEAALARVDSGDPDAVADGIRSLDRMGANAAADRARALLRARGETRVPRRSTHRVGVLTRREHEVLTLVAQGLHTVDISARLHLSPRTVDNHIAAAMQRLGVSSRTDAVAVAGIAPGSIDDAAPD